MKELALVILNWNNGKDTIECLDSLYHDKDNFDVFLLDNGSKEAEIFIVKNYLENCKFENIICTLEEYDGSEDKELNYIISKENYGFAVGNNLICEKIKDKYKYILLLNNDTVVEEKAISKLLKVIKEKRYSAITCYISNYYNKEKVWSFCGNFSLLGDRKYYSQKYIDSKKSKGVNFIDAEFITGCVLLFDTGIIKNRMLFTDKFFHGQEDFNLCKRIKKDKQKAGAYLGATVYHKISASSASNKKVSSVNSDVLFYTCRIIDFKSFYKPVRYWFWKKLYLFLVTLNYIIKYGMKNGFKLRKKIKYYTKKYDNVKKDVFELIIDDKT